MIPAWAEKTLGPKPTAFDAAEFELLRDFFETWENLHKVPRTRGYKDRMEQIAANLVSKAMTIRRLRK